MFLMLSFATAKATLITASIPVVRILMALQSKLLLVKDALPWGHEGVGTPPYRFSLP
jgi:hypothetical protein